LEGPSLNAVPAALELAARVVAVLEHGGTVILDLRAVERLTPSFANALAMTILDAAEPAEFRSRVDVRTGSDAVRESWSSAVSRYERGIRLSTQRKGAA
jgi:hypothetical protein